MVNLQEDGSRGLLSDAIIERCQRRLARTLAAHTKPAAPDFQALIRELIAAELRAHPPRAPMELCAFGEAFAALRSQEATPRPDGGWTLAPSVEARRRGAVFTPPGLALEIARDLICPILETRTEPRQIAALRILDPAMGTGRFLWAALHILAEAYIARGGDPDRALPVLAPCLQGADIDPAAIAIARLLYESIAPPPAPFLHGDALLGPPLPEGLDPERYRELVEADRAGGSDRAAIIDWPALGPWDVILGNPPYRAFGLRDRRALTPTRRALYRALYPATARYKFCLYALFIERAQALLGPEGRAALLVPDSILIGRSFEEARRQVLAEGRRVRGLRLFPGSCWSSVTVGRSLVLEIDARPDPDATLRWRAEEADGPERSLELPRSFYAAVPRARLHPLFSEPERALFMAAHRGPPLASVLDLMSSLISRDGRRASIVFDRERTRGRAAAPLLTSGRALRPFAVSWDQASYAVLEPGLYRSGYHPDRYRRPKLLINQTGAWPKVCADFSGLFCVNNIHIGNLKATTPGEKTADRLHALAGLLNSRPARLIYLMLAREGGRALAQIDLDLLRDIPLPPAFGPGGDPRALAPLIRIARARAGAKGRPDDDDGDPELDALAAALYELDEDLLAEVARGLEGLKDGRSSARRRRRRPG